MYEFGEIKIDTMSRNQAIYVQEQTTQLLGQHKMKNTYNKRMQSDAAKLRR
jgi:hypothetical protein